MRPEIRTTLIKTAFPTHIASFLFAYVLFSTYIGQSSFSPQPIDAFRGWGLDLSFLAIPTQGILWLPDLLGLSLERSNELYFGDSSVWKTTYALPILLFGLAGWWYSKRTIKISSGILIVATGDCQASCRLGKGFMRPVLLSQIAVGMA